MEQHLRKDGNFIDSDNITSLSAHSNESQKMSSKVQIFNLDKTVIHPVRQRLPIKTSYDHKFDIWERRFAIFVSFLLPCSVVSANQKVTYSFKDLSSKKEQEHPTHKPNTTILREILPKPTLTQRLTEAPAGEELQLSVSCFLGSHRREDQQYKRGSCDSQQGDFRLVQQSGVEEDCFENINQRHHAQARRRTEEQICFHTQNKQTFIAHRKFSHHVERSSYFGGESGSEFENESNWPDAQNWHSIQQHPLQPQTKSSYQTLPSHPKLIRQQDYGANLNIVSSEAEFCENQLPKTLSNPVIFQTSTTQNANSFCNEASFNIDHTCYNQDPDQSGARLQGPNQIRSFKEDKLHTRNLSCDLRAIKGHKLTDDSHVPPGNIAHKKISTFKLNLNQPSQTATENSTQAEQNSEGINGNSSTFVTDGIASQSYSDQLLDCKDLAAKHILSRPNNPDFKLQQNYPSAGYNLNQTESLNRRSSNVNSVNNPNNNTLLALSNNTQRDGGNFGTSSANSNIELNITNQINEIIDSLSNITINSNLATPARTPITPISQSNETANTRFIFDSEVINSTQNLLTTASNLTTTSIGDQNNLSSSLFVHTLPRMPAKLRHQQHLTLDGSVNTSRDVSPLRSPILKNNSLNMPPAVPPRLTPLTSEHSPQSLDSSIQLPGSHKNSFSINSSSGYYSTKLEHSPTSTQEGSVTTQNQLDDSTINFWSRPGGGGVKIPSASNTIDSSSNGSYNMDHVIDMNPNDGDLLGCNNSVEPLDNFTGASGNLVGGGAEGNVAIGGRSLGISVIMGGGDNDDNSSGSKDTTLSHNTTSSNKQCCKQTMETLITISSLIEDIELDLHKIVHEAKPNCVHKSELSDIVNNVTGSQTSGGGTLRRKWDSSSLKSGEKGSSFRSRSVSDVTGGSSFGRQTASVHDYVPFDFQLLDVAEKIKEVNNLAKNVNLSENVSNRIASINTKWRDIRADMQGYLIKEKDLDLGYQMTAPWKRKVASNGVPYFFNTSTNKTQWDHPLFLVHLRNVESKTSEVQLSAYKIALKCRATQKFFILSHLKAEDILQICLDYATINVITVNQLEKLIKRIYSETVKASKRPLVADLLMSWIIRMYDPRRSGSLRFDSLLTALILMSSSTPAEKFYYLFKLVADDNMLLDQPRLSILLYDIIQVPLSFLDMQDSAIDASTKDSSQIPLKSSRSSDFLSNSTFNVEGAVQSCLSFKPKATPEQLCRGLISIDLNTWMSWVNEEPQCLVWASLTHRIMLSEETVHKYKCSICATYPIKGFRYRCLKCFNFNMCQNCFFMGLNYQFHKPNHPIQEYCTSQKSSEGVKVMFTVLKNRFITSKYQLAYLPTTQNSNDHRSYPFVGITDKMIRDDSSIASDSSGTLHKKHQPTSKCWSKALKPKRAKSVDNLDQAPSPEMSKHGNNPNNSTKYEPTGINSPNSILSNKENSSKSSNTSPHLPYKSNSHSLRRPINKQSHVQFGTISKNGSILNDSGHQHNNQATGNNHHVSFHLLNSRSNESLEKEEHMNNNSVHVGVPRRNNSLTPSLCRSSTTFRGSTGKS